MITEEHFNQEIAKLNSKLNAIYQILKEQSTPTVTNPIVNNTQSVKPTGDLVPKNNINWDAFNTISDPNDLNIATGMHSNKYPTITSGQFKLLRDIASKHKIDISI